MPGGDPLVSVITPCLNPGSRLERCLASVRRQTYAGSIEHLVIDGGSTDGTVDVLRSVPGLRWRSEADKGQTDAINKGYADARGNYLTWLNADDVLAPDAVSRCVRAFRANPRVGWVYGDVEYVRGDERWIRRSPSQVTLASFRERVPVPQPGTFIARWAWDQVGPLDENLDLAMDLDLWVRLIGAGIESAHAGGVLASFELHAGSKTADPDLRPRFREQTLVYARHGHDDLAVRAAERWSWYATMRRFVEALGERDTRTARRTAWDELRRYRVLRPRRVFGLLLMALAPRAGAGLLRRTGAWAD